MEYFVFSNFVVYLCISTLLAKDSLEHGDTEVTWYEAVDNCTANGQKLLDISSLPKTGPKWTSIKTQYHGSAVWTPRYSNTTNFYWVYGCVKVESSSSILTKRLGGSISLANCALFCGHSFQMIGLKAYTCYCLNRVDLDRNAPDKCNIPCVGERKDTCGGRDHVSIYKQVYHTDIPFNLEGLGNCVYVSNPNKSEHSASIVWGTDNCNAVLDGFVCQSYKTELSSFEYPVYYAYGRKNWYQSRDFCSVALNMTFANVYSVNHKLKTMRDNEKYWIGLYRRDFPDTVDSLCSVISITDAGVEKQVNCSDKHKFVCQRDDMDTTTHTANRGQILHQTSKFERKMILTLMTIIYQSFSAYKN